MQGKLLLLLGILPFLGRGQAVLQSTPLPILVINTNGREIVDEPKITASLGVIYNGPGMINRPTDTYNVYNGPIGIEIRGQSSQSFPKKGYGFELRNAAGGDVDAALLGMPEESDWVLHGPYSDKSLIRNALAYNLASRVMEYAPRTRFCELILNGDYRGVYLLTERIKRDKNRVDVNKLDPDENAGEAVTGGYILRHDKEPETEQNGWISPYPPFAGAWQKTWFFYLYPKPEDITSPQKAYIRSFIADLEMTLRSPGYADPVNGYRRYIDAGTFIDYMWVNELAKNIDAYRLSTYMYKEKDSDGGKLKMGPVWDFNLAFGNVNYCDGASTAGWVLDFNRVCANDYWVIHFWWDRLREDPAFRREAQQRWQELRRGVLRDEAVLGMADSLVAVVAPAVNRNFARWPVLNEYVWPNNFIGGNHPAEVDYLKNWLRSRLAWLDAAAVDLVTGSASPALAGASLRLFPNPAGRELNLALLSPRAGQGRVRLYSTLGELVASLEAGPLSAGEERILPWSHTLPRGVYVATFFLDGQPLGSRRLVVGE